MPTRRVGLPGCCVVLRPHGCCGRRVCCPAGRAAWCAGGRWSFCFLLVAPTDLRPPRGLPARSPSAPRASLGASARSPARPRRPWASQPGPPVTAGALHASGAWALIGGSICRPETQLWLSTSNFACNSPEALSNHELTTLELQRFQILLKLHPIELHASFLRGGRMGARWWRSWRPLARCVVV